MFCIIQLKTISNTYSKKKIHIENNYYLPCMHAVFMGTTTASRNDGGGDASLPSDGVEKSEVLDKTG